MKLYAQTTPCAIFKHPILPKKKRKLHFKGAPKYPKEQSEHNMSLIEIFLELKVTA